MPAANFAFEVSRFILGAHAADGARSARFFRSVVFGENDPRCFGEETVGGHVLECGKAAKVIGSDSVKKLFNNKYGAPHVSLVKAEERQVNFDYVIAGIIANGHRSISCSTCCIAFVSWLAIAFNKNRHCQAIISLVNAHSQMA